MALFASGNLFLRAVFIFRIAKSEGRCEAVRTLARGRVENEMFRSLVVLLVLIAGISQVVSPPPVLASPLRWWFQLSWTLIAGVNLSMSLRSSFRVKRVIDIIERERASGRMQGE
jgi:protein-S-isoprenylcysteine O-methyltransferase Ste14